MLGHTSDHDVEFVGRSFLQTLHFLIDNKDELKIIKKNYLELNVKTYSIKITKKAKELADANNINISELEILDKIVIREKDIQAQINIQKLSPNSGNEFSPNQYLRFIKNQIDNATLSVKVAI